MSFQTSMLLMNSVKRQLTLKSNASRAALTADKRLYATSSENEIETCGELNDLSLSSAYSPKCDRQTTSEISGR